MSKPRVIEVDADLIDEIPENVRSMTDEEFALLVRSIRENGMVEPIQVVEKPDGRFQIVNGQHRFEALVKVLGWRKIPVIVVGKMCSEGEQSDNCWDEVRYWSEVIRLNNIRGNWITPQLAKRVLWLWEHYKKTHDEDEFRSKLGFTTGSSVYKRAMKYREKRARKVGRKARRVSKVEPDERIHDIAVAVAEALKDAEDVYSSQGFFIVWYGGREFTIIEARPELKEYMLELQIEGGKIADKLVEVFKRAKACGGGEGN